jgi:hypothetical protein
MLPEEGQVLTGPQFSEPVRVETVRANGPGNWVLGVVGIKTAIGSSASATWSVVKAKIKNFYFLNATAARCRPSDATSANPPISAKS